MLKSVTHGFGRSDCAAWYLICGYVRGLATSCANGISSTLVVVFEIALS
ncbi:MAG TPA: hypothetical protein VHJ38_07810 [Nitrososphaeraceae archaeon]|nr:hypothetical protein [Nitrososphaeraceae archaeon]